MHTSVWALLVVALFAVAGCGQEPAEHPGAAGESTLLATVAPDEHVVGPAPSTTSPEPLSPLDCTEEPETIAERTLVARRQQASSPGCLAASVEQTAPPVCWHECADGTTFVDFTLEVEREGAEAAGPEVEFPYAAMYRSADGTIDRRAETMVMHNASGSWTVEEVHSIDLSAQIERALAAGTRYFEALAIGDHDSAAALLVADRGATATDRDDLARLAEDGFLDSAEEDAGAVAAALAAWCDVAACRPPDALVAEVAADHTVKVRATYETDLGAFDVLLDAGGQEIPYVRGLPPILP